MNKTKINAADVLVDIRKGMSRTELKEKYRLSEKGLNSLFLKLQYALYTEESYLDKVTERQVSAREILRDIKAGVSEPDLMAKYKISAMALNTLYEDLKTLGLLDSEPSGRRVPARELITDMYRGLNEPDLMEKYSLSTSELKNLLEQMLVVKLLKPEQLVNMPMFHQALGVSGVVQAFAPLHEFTVCDVLDLETSGSLEYITADAVYVSGLSASADEVKTVVLQSPTFMYNKPLVFDVKCSPAVTGTASTPLVRLTIIQIAPIVLREYKELIAYHTMPVEDSGEFASIGPYTVRYALQSCGN